ncbi:glycosyltransferase family protein [Runella sp.]|uniref:glycosyltransferase family protein n=1 Tax=Runella sp. TaxID=1960881 RepID=UPI003D0ECAD1
MKKVLFLVQGEGRGHLTQAISMSQTLREAGYQLVAVLVGGNAERPIPSFFYDQIHAPTEAFSSPNLVFNAEGKVDFKKTVTHHLPNILRFGKSLQQINKAVKHYQPDLILNFYEILGGFYNWLYRPSIPMICVGHQYLFFHSEFQFPQKGRIDRFLVNFNSRLTALRAKRLLALSFDALSDQPAKQVYVVSPLLRHDVHSLAPSQKEYILVYLNHPALYAQILQWHQQHPEVALHCFWSKPEAPSEEKIDNTLTLHRLDGTKFLEMMSGCKALVTTAGFESVCEAMYLDKPVMVVPIHYEQACNAADTERVGAGVAAKQFDLSILMNYLPQHQPVGENFRQWCREGTKQWLMHLESVA